MILEGQATRRLSAVVLLLLLASFCRENAPDEDKSKLGSPDLPTAGVVRTCHDSIVRGGAQRQSGFILGAVRFENLRGAAGLNEDELRPDDGGRFAAIKTPTALPPGHEVILEVVNEKAGGLVYDAFRSDGRYAPHETEQSIRLVGCSSEGAVFNGGFVPYGAGCLDVRIHAMRPSTAIHDARVGFAKQDC